MKSIESASQVVQIINSCMQVHTFFCVDNIYLPWNQQDGEICVFSFDTEAHSEEADIEAYSSVTESHPPMSIFNTRPTQVCPSLSFSSSFLVLHLQIAIESDGGRRTVRPKKALQPGLFKTSPRFGCSRGERGDVVLIIYFLIGSVKGSSWTLFPTQQLD